MSAGASIRKPGAKHHDDSAKKCAKGTSAQGRAEPFGPDRGDGLSLIGSAGERGGERAEEDSEDEHELPVDLHLFLCEVFVGRHVIRGDGPFDQAGGPHESGGRAQENGLSEGFRSGRCRKNSQKPGKGSGDIGHPTIFQRHNYLLGQRMVYPRERYAVCSAFVAGDEEGEVFLKGLEIFFVHDFIAQNLNHEVVSDGVGGLGLLQQFFVGDDRTLLAFDVLIEKRVNVGVGRRIIAAVGLFHPILRGKKGDAAELDDAEGEHIGVAEFIRGVLGQFRHYGIFHRSFGNFGAEPVLIIGEPFVCECLIKERQEFFDVHSYDFATFRAHGILPCLFFAIRSNTSKKESDLTSFDFVKKAVTPMLGDPFLNLQEGKSVFYTLEKVGMKR